jgi:hypothetical protein
MMFRRLRQISSKHRRFLAIIAAVILVVLLIGVYIFWSMNTWGSYKSSYEDWQKDFHTRVDRAITLPVATQPERASKMTALQDISNTVGAGKQSLCTVSPVIEWQHVVGSLKEQEVACQEIIKNADELNGKLRAVTQFLKNEQVLAAILTTAAKDTEGKTTEASWAGQLTAWKTASEVVAGMASEVSFTPVKAAALEKIQSIESAWQELLTAHQAKDKSKYIEAQVRLGEAYNALPSVQTVGATQLAGLTSLLETEYREVFGT